MPYKQTGVRVYVKRHGKWVLLKAHSSVAKAKRHVKALRANVRHR